MQGTSTGLTSVRPSGGQHSSERCGLEKLYDRYVVKEDSSYLSSLPGDTGVYNNLNWW